MTTTPNTLFRSLATANVTRAEESDSYIFTISTPQKDRHGTVILPTAWRLDNYNANPIVAYQHHTGDDWMTGRTSDPDDIIGKSTVWLDGQELVAQVEFEPADLNEKADKIRRKLDFGSLRAVSVGFRMMAGHWGEEKRGEDTDTYYFDEVELLEFSIVNIPSNPGAVKRSLEEHNRTLLPQKPAPETPVDQVEKSRSMAMNHNIFKQLNLKRNV